MKQRGWYKPHSVFLVFVVTWGLGCSESPEDMLRRSNSSRSKQLANLYMMYQAGHGWVGPKDETDFKEFIQGVNSASLEKMGVDVSDIEALFTSERDGEPFKIRYQVRGGMGASDPVIFEATGKRGKRIVGFTAMREVEVESDEEYDKLWSGEYEKASTSREDSYGGGEGSGR